MNEVGIVFSFDRLPLSRRRTSVENGMIRGNDRTDCPRLRLRLTFIGNDICVSYFSPSSSFFRVEEVKLLVAQEISRVQIGEPRVMGNDRGCLQPTVKVQRTIPASYLNSDLYQCHTDSDQPGKPNETILNIVDDICWRY